MKQFLIKHFQRILPCLNNARVPRELFLHLCRQMVTARDGKGLATLSYFDVLQNPVARQTK